MLFSRWIGTRKPSKYSFAKKDKRMKSLPHRKPMLLVYFLSGISGLIYQVVWLRLMAEIFGNSTYALSTVLAAFMAGLAIGSWQGGQRIAQAKSSVTVYIKLELGIAVTAAITSILLANFYGWYAPIYRLIDGNLIALSIAQFIFCFVLIFLPTMLMGATVPTMARIIMNQVDKIGRDFSSLYALNTLGGMIGVLLSSFLLIEHLGLYWTLAIAITLNLLIGLGVFFLFREPVDTSPIDQSNDSQDSHIRNQLSLFAMLIIPAVGFATGFIAFSLEILWTRSLVFYVGNTTYSFALILLLILMGIAGGSFLVQKFVHRIKNTWHWVVGILCVIAIGTLASIPLFHSVFAMPAFTPDLDSWSGYLIQNLFKTALVVFIPSFGMGLTFPLLNSIYIESIQFVGKRVGSLYAWNTLGAIIGSLVTGFLLIPIFGISAAIAGTAVLILGVSAVIIWYLYSRKHPRLTSAMGGGLLFLFTTSWLIVVQYPDYPMFRSYDEHDIDEVLFYDEGVTATTTVYLTEQNDKKMTVDGVLMGGDFPKAMRKQVILADLPLLLRPNAKTIYVVGLGTGITFEEFFHQQPEAKILCSEISSSVINGSELFQSLSTRVSTIPNVDLLFEDGKNYLKFYPDLFDVISSDTMLKKGSAGNSTMYSKEYYTLCRDKLTDSGLFIQWVPLYLSPDIQHIILNTIRQVFPHTTLWYVGDEALVHISSIKPLDLDISILQKTFNQADLKKSFDRIGIESLDAILSTYLMDDFYIDSMLQTSDVNSIVHPIVEFMTPRELTSNSAALVIENLIKLLESSAVLTKSPRVLSIEDVPMKTLKLLDHHSKQFKTIMDGLMYGYAGKTKQAKRIIANVLAQNPEDSNARHYLGISNAYPTDSDKARKQLEAGIVLRELGSDSLARVLLGNSLSIKPKNLFALNELSLVYLSMGDLKNAISITEDMIAIDPKNSLFYFNLGYYFELAKDYPKAMLAYNMSKSLNSSNSTLDQRMHDLDLVMSK